MRDDNWERERQLDRDGEREPSFLRGRRPRPYRNATEQRDLAHETLTIRFGGDK
jgi:hypothetical protein